MIPVGIVSALTAEARHLRPAARHGGRPHVSEDALTELPDGALLAVSGMGLEAAASAARTLIARGARALLSFGLAGGLDPQLGAGTVCLPTEVVSREGERLATTPDWREGLAQALAGRCRVSGGTLLSSPVALDSLGAKARALRDTGAASVDMESLSVGREAARHGLPFMVVRVIVDTARDTLPEVVSRCAGPGGQVPLPRLLGALAVRPGELPAVIRLGGRYRAASRALAAVAGSGSLAPPVAA